MGTAAGAGEALVEVERLRKAVWGARRGSSVPLLAFGFLTACYIPFAGDISSASLLYWSVVGPLSQEPPPGDQRDLDVSAAVHLDDVVHQRTRWRWPRKSALSRLWLGLAPRH
jgi:hypothetical protein